MSIIATVIGSVILAIRKITNKKISPRCNYIIWIVFIIALIFPVSIPSKISIYNYIDISNIKNTEKIEISNEYSLPNMMNDNQNDEKILEFMKDEIITNNGKISTKYIMIIIVDIWFAISTTKLIYGIRSYRFLINAIGNDEVVDERIIKILERCKKKLKIKKNIKVIRQKVQKIPSIIGIYDIKILFTGTILELDDVYIEDIMMHELSHYKRKDNILNIVMTVLKSFYWFNPMINKFFKHIKTDIELATDEMAISKMEREQKREYCKVMVGVSAICNLNIEPILGLVSTKEVLENRVDMIFLKDDFEKYAIPIAIFTFMITTLLWFLLYPTSYGKYDVPKLYLQSANGNRQEIPNIEQNDNFDDKVIKLNKGESLKLIIDDGNCNSYVVYNKNSLDKVNINLEVFEATSDKLIYFDVGEYIYNFTLINGNNEITDYAVKIIVE